MLKMQTRSNWDAFDVIKAIFAFLPKEETVPSSSPVLHETLHSLTLKRKYKKFLHNYVFDLQSYFPYSREFQTDLINLEQAGLLSSSNPDFIDYMIKDKLRKTFENHTKGRFTADEIEILKKMSKDFRTKLLSCHT